jgi:hypothetical protein
MTKMTHTDIERFETNLRRLMESEECTLVLHDPSYNNDSEEWLCSNATAMIDMMYLSKTKKVSWNVGVWGDFWCDTELGGDLCRVAYYEDEIVEGNYKITINPHKYFNK